MDSQVAQRMDSIVEDEVVRGFRVLDLPDALTRVLVADGLKGFTQVRFIKQTPRKRRLIQELVVKRYHQDLRNKDLLSNEQLRQMNIERGEWSLAKEERLKVLSEQTSAEMRELYLDGIDRREEWALEILEAAARYLESLVKEDRGELPALTQDEQEFLRRVLDRWMTFEPEQQEAYDQAFAGMQGLSRYSPDADLRTLLDSCPNQEIADAVNKIGELKDKLRRLLAVTEKRREQGLLQNQQARMYAESVESRRDTTEEMARLFYLTEVLEDNKPRPLAATFDEMWDLPDTVIQWLLVELYFFLNGVPDAAREYLSEWGFIPALPANGSPDPSAESLAEPNVKPDGLPSEPTPSGSSE